MEITDVMRLALSPFGPDGAYMEQAVAEAIAAGERLIVSLGIGKGSIDYHQLRSAALEEWQSYCDHALETSFFITSLTREDLIEYGATREEARSLSDQDMEAIAKRMENLYVSNGSYWSDMTSAVNELLQEKGMAEINFSDEEE